MAHDVFLSYAAEDQEPADRIRLRLESDGVTCWIAPRDILPGREWGEAIVAAIEASRVMVLVFSAHADAPGLLLRCGSPAPVTTVRFTTGAP